MMSQEKMIDKIENGMKMYYCREEQKYFPETRTDEKTGAVYRLDPETWTYHEMIQVTSDPEEIALLNEPIGIYGQRWQEFMEENYPQRILELQLNLRWAIIPRLIEREAEEMISVLENNYMEKNPIPKNFLERAAYCKTMQLEISGIVMREIVLQLRE